MTVKQLLHREKRRKPCKNSLWVRPNWVVVGGSLMLSKRMVVTVWQIRVLTDAVHILPILRGFSGYRHSHSEARFKLQIAIENPPFGGIKISILKFRRVTIRGAQPSARLSEEIRLSEGSAGVSPRAPRGLSEGSAGSLRGSAGVRGIFRGFRG